MREMTAGETSTPPASLMFVLIPARERFTDRDQALRGFHE